MKHKDYIFHQFKNEKGGTTVVARTKYAGKTVKGYAKCRPEDEFDFEKGKKLAAARCNLKISQKRQANAANKYLEASAAVDKALEYYEKMKHYYMDAVDQVDEAAEELRNIIAKLS